MNKKTVASGVIALLLLCAAAMIILFRPPETETLIESPPPTDEPAPEPTVPPELAALEVLREKQAQELDFLTLVNRWNPLAEDYEIDLYPLGDEKEIDRRCVDSLRQMIADCKDAGNDPYVCSAYRSYEDQLYLFMNKYYRVILEGVAEEDANAEVMKSVAEAGTSEHQLGLAVDIVSYSYPELDEQQEQTGVQQWLMENSWKYGFILRYPNGTSDITGIIYEPWHYRYVGNIAAEAIHERGITLEQYLQLLFP